MDKELAAISMAGGAVAFGASGAVLSAVQSGVPFLPAAILAALGAALVVHMTAHHVRSAPQAPSRGLEEQVRQLDAHAATLRHDMRGALSPALMLSERLLRSEDPTVRRTGQVVVQSIERAVDLLTEDKREPETPGAAGAAASPARSHAAGIGARGP